MAAVSGYPAIERSRTLPISWDQLDPATEYLARHVGRGDKLVHDSPCGDPLTDPCGREIASFQCDTLVDGVTT